MPQCKVPKGEVNNKGGGMGTFQNNTEPCGSPKIVSAHVQHGEILSKNENFFLITYIYFFFLFSEVTLSNWEDAFY